MIQFENVSQSYKNKTVLDNISFNVEKGEIVVLIGPSGCGKTTTLKMINSLIKPSKGRILIHDEDISLKDPIKLRRNIGYVIQQIGLFPHLTARENIEIIPHIERKDKEEINKRTLELMRMINMDSDEFLDRYPVQLSGGQQQRIGVARAFSSDPEIILMDEPFSALDPVSRVQLQDELIELQANLKKTIVFVTHDMDEAIKLGDRICIMNEGKIAQYDTPEKILKYPSDQFVADFVGKNRIWANPELIRAQDIMIKEVVRATPDISIELCLERMRSNHVESLVITDKDRKLMGIIRAEQIWTQKDLSKPVSTIIDTNISVYAPDQPILPIINNVVENNLNHVLIADNNGILKGIISRGRLVTILSQPFIENNEQTIIN